MKAEILDHVLRPDLPWRKADTVECGRLASGLPQVISRDELLARLKHDGRMRTAMAVCMTCLTKVNSWMTFEENPVDAMRREVYSGAPDDRLSLELRALGVLAVAYREEFDAYIAGLNQTANLAERRNRRRA